jgi:hypothetical protein
MQKFLTLTSLCVLTTLFLSSALRAQTASIVTDAQASRHVSQNVIVEGIVTAVSTSKKGNTFINLAVLTQSKHLRGGFQLAHRWQMTNRCRHSKGKTSKYSARSTFIAENLESRSFRKIRSFRTRKCDYFFYSSFASLLFCWTVQADVIRGVLLNDDDPYIARTSDGTIIKSNGMRETAHGPREIE